MKYLLQVVIFFLFIVSVRAQSDVKTPNIPGEIMIDLGLNLWSSIPSGLERQVWPSKSVSIYYVRKKILSKNFVFNYGLGFSFDRIGLGDSATLASNLLVGTEVFPVAIVPLKENTAKNKLITNYLEIPIEFRYYPLNTVAGKGLFISVGGIIGLRLDSYTKIKYSNNGETTREKISGKFNLNPIRYGYQVRLGLNGVHFFYKRHFSSVFNDAFADGSNPVISTWGINVTGF